MNQDHPTTSTNGRLALPLAVAFIAGLCTMAVEIAAGRLVSRDLGNSIYTWTSIIGIVLGGLSGGNILGGRLADQASIQTRLLGAAFSIAGVLVAAIPVINHFVGSIELLWTLSWPARIFCHTAAVFLLPSLSLGTMGPIAARLCVANSPASISGRNLGYIYALGAVGSIVGTFLTGFLLISMMGLPKLFYSIAATLIVFGVSLWIRTRKFWWGGGVPMLLMLVGRPYLCHDYVTGEDNAIMNRESRYSHIMVTADANDTKHRTLYLDRLKHTEMDVSSPATLQYEYFWMYDAVVQTVAGPAPSRVSTLILGGGGFAVPPFLQATRPGSRIDVVEIDTDVVDAAHRYFSFTNAPATSVHTLDARNFIAQENQKTGKGSWDVIIGDLFSDYSVPTHMCTREALLNIKALLTTNGCYMLNLIDILDQGAFLGSVLCTFETVFPYTYAFSCNRDARERDTFIVVGSSMPLDEAQIMRTAVASHPFSGETLSHELRQRLMARRGVTLLTDDYSPVDMMIATVVRADKSGTLERLNAAGVREGRRGNYTAALGLFDKALAACPSSDAALNNRGRTLQALGRPEEALRAYACAIAAKPANMGARKAHADLLAAMGRMTEALKEWNDMLAINPDLPDVHDNIGVALAMSGDRANARKHWLRALRSSLDRPLTWFNMGASFAQDGDAIAAYVAIGQAVTLDPSNNSYAQTLSQIRTASESAGVSGQKLDQYSAESPAEILDRLSQRIQ